MNPVSTARVAGRLILLAPPDCSIPKHFRNVDADAMAHRALLSGMQKLRGRLYIDDGALRESDLDCHGRHCSPADEAAWHLLSVNDAGEVMGCARYVSHPDTDSFFDLGVSRCPLLFNENWAGRFRWAVESDMDLARSRGLAYVEVGGWALAHEYRCSAEAIRLALSSYSLARALGGCIGVGTATVRHCSASILRRIGGRALSTPDGDLPNYYDPHYDCEMALLRFDSEAPNPRFAKWIDEIYESLAAVPVVRQTHSLLNLHIALTMVESQPFLTSLRTLEAI